MISNGDYFRNPIAKRSLIACVVMASCIIAPAAWAGDQGSAKKSQSRSSSVQVNGKPVVMEFNASYCVPCKKFAPIFERAKTNFGSKADFRSIDFESTEGEKIAGKYGVSSLPYIIILDGKGKVVFRKNGILEEQAFVAEVTKVIGK